MKNHVTVLDDFLNVGEDWFRNFTISNESLDPTLGQAVLKVRDTKTDTLLAVADCKIINRTVQATIKASDTLTIPRHIRRGKYDLFIIIGDISAKLVVGEIEIIPDVSMH